MYCIVLYCAEEDNDRKYLHRGQIVAQKKKLYISSISTVAKYMYLKNETSMHFHYPWPLAKMTGPITEQQD